MRIDINDLKVSLENLDIDWERLEAFNENADNDPDADEFKDSEVTTGPKGGIQLKIKHPGAMTEYCENKGYSGVTCGCLCDGMRDPDPIWHKRANFAYVFGFKRNNKTCACMEAIYAQNKKKKK